MDVTAVTESVKKKLTNSRIKRSCSFTAHCPSKRSNNVGKTIQTRDYFLHQRIFTDVKIQLNNEIIWCEKAFLAAASPILCEQLCQLNSNENLLILEDIDLEQFLSFLEFIYPVFNPQINQKNISSLVKLAHRFQFNVLEHACQLYIMQYLSTIRHVSRRCQTLEDYFSWNSSNDDQNLQAISNKSDLIEFHDGTCIDANNIIVDLCQWLETYFPMENNPNIIVRQSSDIRLCLAVMNILQQVSVDQLDAVFNAIDLRDQIKGYIYKQRAEYLESLSQIKRDK